MDLAAPTSESLPPAHRPLEGIRVVDMSRYLPGPFCSLQLSWLGAQVTCVEQPPHGDPLRTFAPLDGDGISLAYRSLRRDADVVLLDLAREADRDAALELVDAADVFVESFRPGVAARLGFGVEELRERNPGLVYCSISGFGQTGPWATAPGHDIGYEAAAGLLEQNGTVDELVLPAVPLADLAGGWGAATAICAALLRRASTSTGTHIDLSLTEAALALQAMHLPSGTTPAFSTRARGALTGGLASYRPYQCADGQWIAIGPIEPKFFATLCTLLERPDLAERQYDLADQDELRAELAAVFATRDAAAWERLLVGADGGHACAVRVLHPGQVHLHPQHEARGAVLPLDTADAGDAWMPASPYVLDGARSDSGAPVSPGQP